MVQGADRADGADDLHARILELLREMGQAVDRMQDDLADTAGLNRSELGALLHLEEAPEPVTMRHLSDGLSLTPGAITALVDRLEARGHVRRGSDPEDRRRVIVTTTETADAVATSFFGALAGRVLDVLGGYDRDQLVLIEDFLRRLVPALTSPSRD